MLVAWLCHLFALLSYPLPVSSVSFMYCASPLRLGAIAHCRGLTRPIRWASMRTFRSSPRLATSSTFSPPTLPSGPPTLTLYQESDDGLIAWLTLNNPDKRNALSMSMLKEIREQMRKIESQKKLRHVVPSARLSDIERMGVRADCFSCRVLILRANGPVFSSGHDLKEIEAYFEVPPGFMHSLFFLLSFARLEA